VKTILGRVETNVKGGGVAGFASGSWSIRIIGSGMQDMVGNVEGGVEDAGGSKMAAGATYARWGEPLARVLGTSIQRGGWNESEEQGARATKKLENVFYLLKKRNQATGVHTVFYLVKRHRAGSGRSL